MRKMLFLVLLFFTISEGYSCSCALKPPVKANWENANEVFIGRIVKVDSSHFGNNGAMIYSYTVKIVKSFKEKFHDTRALRTIVSQDNASCSYMFNVGKEYLIYAKSDSNTLASSICSRTNLTEFVEEGEFIELEKLHKEYVSDTSEMRTINMESNTAYQVELVKKPLEEIIENQKLIIYILSGVLIFLLMVLIIIRKRKI